MTARYDVFLSHNSADKAAVEEIATWLRDEAGLRPFLDKWHLVPGESWIPALERALEESATVAVFFGPAGLSGWHDEEKQLALDLAHRARQAGRRVIPVLLPGGRKEDVEGFLKLRTWVDLATHDGFIRLVAGIQGQAPELFAGLQPGPVLRQRLAELSPAHVVVDPLARVRREIIDFSAERNRHKHFFGREDVFAEMDAWVAKRDSGWLLIAGSPGLGKSALMDRWLRRREAVESLTAFHFIRRGHLDWAEPQVVQRNLAAQIEVMFPEQRDAEADPTYRLEQLLGRMGPVLADRGERLVLLVDGLDEAMTLGKDNPIPYIFPLEVPDRVFVVTASRPRYPHLNWFHRRTGATTWIDLDERVESNEQAVRGHWQRLGATMVPPLREELIHAAIGGAKGNLLHAVKLFELWSRPKPERSPGDVPQGFEGMLEELWERTGALPKDAKERVRDGLSLICAARESLPLRVVDELLGWDEGEAEDELLPLAREMLLEEPWQEEPVYRPFHEGLRELVERKRPRSIREHHGVLSDYAAWPIEGDTFRRSYALRHRVEHRVESGQVDAAAKACMDVGYLTAKACAEGVVAVERDIRLAADACENDETRGRLTTLGRLVAASSHWASEVPEALPALLHDRALTNAPELLQALVGPAHPSPEHPRLRHALRPRAMSRVLGGQQFSVTALAVLPNGRVVVGLGDKTVQVWDVDSGRTVATLKGHENRVNALAVLPDGRIVSGSGKTVRVWDVDSGRAVATLEGHQGPVMALAVLPDGRVVSGSGDKTVRVWDVDSGRSITTLEGHQSWVRALAVLPDGRVVSGSDDDTVRVWDLASGRTVTTLEGHQGWVLALAVLSNGHVISSREETMRVWDVDGKRVVAALEGHRGSVSTLAVLPNGRVVSGSNDDTVRVWDVDSGQTIATLEGHQGWINALAVLPDGRVVSASNDKTVRMWEVDSGRTVATVQGNRGGVMALAVLPDLRVVSSSGDTTVRVWDADNGRTVAVLDGHQGLVTELAVLPDGRVVSGSDDNTVRVWDVDSGRTIATLEGHRGWVRALAVLPDGRIVSGSDDETVRVWDVDSSRTIAILEGYQYAMRALAVLPDGRLVSGSYEETIRVWDVASGRTVATLEGHRGCVRALAMLPDGRVVSASEDKTLRVWDVESGRTVATVYGNATFPSVAAIDGQFIVAGDALGDVWFIDLPELPRK